MKIFSWIGDQFANNLMNMVLYTGAVYFIGAFSAPLIPGVNGAIYKLLPESVKNNDEA